MSFPIYDELFGDDNFEDLRKSPDPPLSIDDPTFAAFPAGNTADTLCKQLEDERFVDEIAGSRDGYTLDEKDRIVKTMSSPTPFRFPVHLPITRDELTDLLKATSGVCNCECSACTGGHCDECGSDQKCVTYKSRQTARSAPPYEGGDTGVVRSKKSKQAHECRTKDDLNNLDLMMLKLVTRK